MSLRVQFPSDQQAHDSAVGRESAHRINGVERLDDSSIANKADSSNRSISQENDFVKSLFQAKEQIDEIDQIACNLRKDRSIAEINSCQVQIFML